MNNISDNIEDYLTNYSDTVMNTHNHFDYIMHLSSGWFFDDFLRNLGYGIIVFLGWINDFLENIIHEIITLGGFYETSQIAGLMDTIRPIVWGLFLIAVVVLGFQFMMNKVEKRNEVILNVVLALSVIVVIPDLMVNLGSITSKGIEAINPETESLAGNVMKSNIADLYYYAATDFQGSSDRDGNTSSPPYPTSGTDSSVGTTDFTYGNKFNNDSVVLFPVNEKLDIHETKMWWGMGGLEDEKLSDLSTTARAALSTRSVQTGNGEEVMLEPLSKNAITGTEIGRESYYRYHVNWFAAIATLAVTAVAMAITIIKIGRNMFDLAFQQIFLLFIAPTDLTGGQRTKKVLAELVSTFAIIFIMVLLLKIFTFYTTWVNGMKSDVGTIGVILLLVAGAWALIDAPDVVQRVLGIDAGMRSGYQALVGGAVAAGAVGKGAKAATNIAGGIAKGGINAVSGATGMAKGLGKGMKSGGTGGRPNIPNTDLNSINTSSGGGDGPPNNPSNGGGGDDPPNTPPNGGGGGDDPPNIPPGGSGGDNPQNNPPNGGGGGAAPIPDSSGSIGVGSAIPPQNVSGEVIPDNQIMGGSATESEGMDVAGNDIRSNEQAINPIPTRANQSAGSTGQNRIGENKASSNRIPSGSSQNINKATQGAKTVGSKTSGNVKSTGATPTRNEGTNSNSNISNPIPSSSESGSVGSNNLSGSLESAGRSIGNSAIVTSGQSIPNSPTSTSVPSGFTQRDSGIMIPTSVAGSISSGSSNLNNDAIDSGSSTTTNEVTSSNQGIPKATNTLNNSQTVSPASTQVQDEKQTVSPSGTNKEVKQSQQEKSSGHIEANHQNTLSGNSRTVQMTKEKHAQGHNTGYNMGKNITKAGRVLKKAVPKKRERNITKIDD